MVAWVVISRQHLPRASRGPRQAYKSGPIRALPLPYSLFSPSPPVMSHQSLVTRFTVIHPLSIQPLTKCSSRNSFVFKTIHFDGGVYPALYPAALSQLSNLQTCKPSNLSPTYPLSFHTLADAFALTQNSTPLFSNVSALFAKNHPGWGVLLTSRIPPATPAPNLSGIRSGRFAEEVRHT
jgi:hypothetical protein